MAGFLVRRLAGLALALFLSSLIIYSALYLSPGSPLSTLTGGRQVSHATKVSLEGQYHLNDPFVERYFSWVGGAIHGDFGTSVVSQGQSVGSLLGSRIATTVTLIGLSASLIVVIGVALGALAALRRGGSGAAITALTSVGMAIPSFVAASALITVFSVELGWFPVFGAGNGGADRLWHLVLPSASLALAATAYVSQTTQGAVAQELDSDHVSTATVRGLPRRQIIRKHVLRNAAIPITTVSGLMVAYLFVGTAIVEKAFQLNGLGSLLVDSVARHDFPVVQAICLVLVVAFIGINVLIDALYAFLDPRVELW